MTPLQSWSCDACAGVIDGPTKGNVLARRGEGGLLRDWQIRHKTCDRDTPTGYEYSQEIGRLLGDDGLSRLLLHLSHGDSEGEILHQVGDVDEFVDLIRRLQTPFYEEARPHFDEERVQAWLREAGEPIAYLPSTLKHIADGALGK